MPKTTAAGAPTTRPRLLAALGLGNDYVNVRIALYSTADVDDALVDRLRQAYEAKI
jgi:hypothetical protein